MILDTRPTRNLALELVRVTEAAALAAGRYMGRGDKNGADGAAVDAMRLMLNTIEMNGVIVIGEGEKDEAPMLYSGEKLGTGEPPEVDIAVDPIDGTRPLAQRLVGEDLRRAADDRRVRVHRGVAGHHADVGGTEDLAHREELFADQCLDRCGVEGPLAVGQGDEVCRGGDHRLS